MEKEFFVEVDEYGQQYFVANLERHKGPLSKPPKITENQKDICTFLDDNITLSSKQSNLFSTDLTSRDDFLLASLSILIILLAEGILSSLLLRTINGKISNRGFSIKQYVNLARDFKFHHPVKGKNTKSTSGKKRLNLALLLVATLILVLSFSLEAVLLFLSSPGTRTVTTNVASVSFIPAVYPEWKKVQKATEAFIERPCRDVVFQGFGIDMGNTRLIPCVTTNAPSLSFSNFSKTDEEVPVTIISDVHNYGVEHFISIGTESANYSARAHLGFLNRVPTLVENRELAAKKAKYEFLHFHFVAYLFNIYNNKTNDPDMSLKRLNSIDLNFSSYPGPNVFVIELQDASSGSSLWVVSVRHKTNFKAIVPKGESALRFAAVYFRATHALEVSGPDIWYIKMSKGITSQNVQGLWLEQSRSLNWISLILLSVLCILVLVTLRILLKPAGVIEIANAYIELSNWNGGFGVGDKNVTDKDDYDSQVQVTFTCSDQFN